MKKQELTQERLKELVIYDKDTGIFTWKEKPFYKIGKYYNSNTWNTKHAGKEVGSKQSEGYVESRIDGYRVLLHTMAWLYEYGYIPKEIDHIDNVRNHNWISNLREVTRANNLQNLRIAQKNSQSGLLGAFTKRPGQFYSKIGIGYKQIHLGSFNTAEEAHQAYLEAKRELHPFGML